MKPDSQDILAMDTLAWAFSGQRRMEASQYRQVKAAIRESRSANKESPGKRRSRFWKLGPVWARRFA